MGRVRVWLTLLGIATVAFGWASWPRADTAALRPYAAATLVPAEGLGDLRLGETDLAAFVERFGVGRPSALYGDTTALEFTFDRAGMTFRFEVAGECARAVQAMAGTGLRALRSPRAFVRDQPVCATERLTGIEVRAAGSERLTFWRGSTPDGVRLRMPRDEVLARVGLTEEAPFGDEFADAGPAVAALGRVRYVDGLELRFGPERSAQPGDGWVLTALTVVPAP